MVKKEEIIDLDESVIRALGFFGNISVPKLGLPKFSRFLVVGSGNAAVVGKILFSDEDAVFADESNYLEKIKNIKGIDGAVIISASGEKHAPIVAKNLRKNKIKTFLITNNELASARKFVDGYVVFPKIGEPYTYNVSTYLGMILSKTGENSEKILRFIKNSEREINHNFKKYDSFFIILPERFEVLGEMFRTKFDELFGARISARTFTYEQAKHSKTLVPYEKELFIGLGYENKTFGKNRLNLSIPSWADYGFVFAFGYYLIGKIQKQNPPYFKNNLDRYVGESSKIFGKEIKPIA